MSNFSEQTRTDVLRTLRLTRAVLDDDPQIAQLVVNEAVDDGRLMQLALGALSTAHTLATAAAAVSPEAVSAYLDHLALEVMDDGEGQG